MKTAIAIFLIAIFIITSAAPGYCYGPIRKLERGIWNMLTCPAEIPHRMIERTRDSRTLDGVTIGFIEGATMMVFRGGIGFFETLLFPIPIPPKYEPTIKDPEFFFIKVPDDKVPGDKK